jgi:hypothetical protein
MKNLFLLFMLLVISVFLYSCGKEYQEAKNTLNVTKGLYDASKDIDENMAENEAKIEERRKRGDTLPLPKDELIAFLPKSVSGYTAKEPETQFLDFGDFAYSSANIVFEDSEYNTISVGLVDYNQAYSLLAASTFWASMNIETENDEYIERTFKTGEKDIYGYEKINKNYGSSYIHYVVGHRFFISIEATKIKDTDKLKKIAENMNLKKLASM